MVKYVYAIALSSNINEDLRHINNITHILNRMIETANSTFNSGKIHGLLITNEHDKMQIKEIVESKIPELKNKCSLKVKDELKYFSVIIFCMRDRILGNTLTM